MVLEIKLPMMGLTMEEGTIISSRIKPGQKISKGEIIFEIETDKATLEMESPEQGIVKEILVQDGQTIPVGQTLATIENEEITMKPVMKKQAAENPQHVELKPGQKIALNKFQKLTAEKMLKSKHEIPCFYLNSVVDVTELVEFREKLKSEGLKISFNDFIIKAVALGILKWPIMSGRFEGDSIKLADSIGVGLAISIPDGLAAPIVKDAGNKTLQEIAQYSAELIERTKNMQLMPDDIDGGCITVSNLGAFGIESFIPIVVPGQCSIMGVGKISDTCIAADGNVGIKKLMKITLAVDHRIANGAEAAQFLNYVTELLQEPQKLSE